MESRFNSVKVMQGFKLGHIAAASTYIIGAKAAGLSLVETMYSAIEKESQNEAADICMSAMLAFIGDLYGTAKTPPISEEDQAPNVLAVLGGMACLFEEGEES